MKIGVVSDTHAHKLPQKMLDVFQSVDFIIHAGDICCIEALKQLQKIKEVKAVYGNMDDSQMRQILPERQIIEVGQFSIGLFHGKGSPDNLLETVKHEFRASRVHAIVFGHSHRPMNETIDGVLYFNPGSPNDSVSAPFCSYGILEIGEHIIGEIVKID